MKQVIKNIIKTVVFALLIFGITPNVLLSQTLSGTSIDNTCKIQYELLNGTKDSVISNTASVVVVGIPPLKLSKAVFPTTAIYGDTLTYTIIAENPGFMPLYSVIIRDTIPSELSVLSVSKGTLNANVFTYVRDSLRANQPDTIVIVTRVQKELTSGSQIVNKCFGTENSGTTVEASASFNVNATPQIGFQKFASKNTIQEGDTLSYSIRIQNMGDISLTNVILTDTIPTQLAVVSVSANAQESNGVISCSIASLPVGSSDSVIIVTVVKQGLPTSTTIRNIAYVHSRQTLMRAATAAVVSHNVYRVNFNKIGPEKSNAGDTVNYFISVQNPNRAQVVGSVVVDSLDSSMKFINTNPGGIYDANSHLVSWNIPVIDSMASIILSIKVAIIDTISTAKTIVNRAGFSSANAADTNSRVQTLVNVPTKLRIWKVVSSNQGSPGDTLRYTITIANIGNHTADSIIVSDVLPEEVSYISSVPQGVYDSPNMRLTWSLDSLQSRQQRQFIIDVVIKSDISFGEHDFTNIADAGWNGGRINSLLDVSSNAKVNILIPFIQIQKQAIKRIAEVGDIIPFVIRVTNLSSNTTAHSVKIIDDLPLGFGYINGSTFSNSIKISDPSGLRQLQWHLVDSIKPQASVQLMYRLVVGTGALDGKGVNSAYAIASTANNRVVNSNVASDRVEVRRGVFTNRGIVIGKVFYDDNGNFYQDIGEEGIKGVELMTEDGTRVITGDDGKYSLPDVNPGEHVIRLREETLPPYSELVHGYGDFANKSNSRFVKLPESGIARADFYIHRAEPAALKIDHQVSKVGTLSLKRIAEPKHVVFVSDEGLATINIKGTQFEIGKAVLKPETFPTLKAVADLAREFPDQMIIVEGHTDSIPIKTKAFPSNQVLSFARAGSVKDYLVENEKINSSRIRVIGYGEKLPIASNSTSTGRSLNRRVEITLASVDISNDRNARIVNFKVVINYDGSTPISQIHITDKLDTAFHYIPGSAKLDGKNIPTSVDGQTLSWSINNLVEDSDVIISYQAAVYRPKLKETVLKSQSSLKYSIANSSEELYESAVTANEVSSTFKSKSLRFVLSGVLFETGKAILKREAENSLKSAAGVLTAYPNATVLIEGHTDSRPIKTKQFPSNVALSHARAVAVSEYLTEKFGIEKTRLQTFGWGELKPVATNKTNAGRQSNRRVEIKIDKHETTEETLKEGFRDSFAIIKHEVNEPDSIFVYDTTAVGLSGNNFIVRTQVTGRNEKQITRTIIVGELPESFRLIEGTLQSTTGIDSLWQTGNKVFALCSPSDTVHSFKYRIELSSIGMNIDTFNHHSEVRRTLTNGTEIVSKSKSFVIKLKKEGYKK